MRRPAIIFSALLAARFHRTKKAAQVSGGPKSTTTVLPGDDETVHCEVAVEVRSGRCPGCIVSQRNGALATPGPCRGNTKPFDVAAPEAAETTVLAVCVDEVSDDYSVYIDALG